MCRFGLGAFAHCCSLQVDLLDFILILGDFPGNNCPGIRERETATATALPIAIPAATATALPIAIPHTRPRVGTFLLGIPTRTYDSTRTPRISQRRKHDDDI